jgi:hypothetical protein
VDRLSDEELRALELDENTERVDLNDCEASKQRKAWMDPGGDRRRREAEAAGEDRRGGRFWDNQSQKTPPP